MIPFTLAHAAGGSASKFGAGAGIVVVGDSLTCGPFGKAVLQNYKSQGKKNVTIYCAVSSVPQNWLAGTNPGGQQCKTMTSASPAFKPCGGNGRVPQLSTLLKKHKGARFVVALGTNSLLSPRADASYGKMAGAIKSGGHSCDWISPPHMGSGGGKGFSPARLGKLERNVNPFFDSLSTRVDSKCHLVDSGRATARGTPGNQTSDGVHRTEKAGKYWAAQLIPVLMGGGSSSSRSQSSVSQVVR